MYVLSVCLQGDGLLIGVDIEAEGIGDEHGVVFTEFRDKHAHKQIEAVLAVEGDVGQSVQVIFSVKVHLKIRGLESDTANLDGISVGVIDHHSQCGTAGFGEDGIEA